MENTKIPETFWNIFSNPLIPVRKNNHLPDRHERRKKIMQFVKQFGHGNVPIKSLKEEFNVSEMTIYRDINWCIGQLPRPVAEREASKIFNSYEQIRKQAQLLLNGADKDDRVKGAELLLKCNSEEMKFLENRGILEKVADKHMVASVNVDVRQVLGLLEDD